MPQCFKFLMYEQWFVSHWLATDVRLSALFRTGDNFSNDHVRTGCGSHPDSYRIDAFVFRRGKSARAWSFTSIWCCSWDWFLLYLDFSIRKNITEIPYSMTHCWSRYSPRFVERDYSLSWSKDLFWHFDIPLHAGFYGTLLAPVLPQIWSIALCWLLSVVNRLLTTVSHILNSVYASHPRIRRSMSTRGALYMTQKPNSE
jgi:hypothetical protein